MKVLWKIIILKIEFRNFERIAVLFSKYSTKIFLQHFDTEKLQTHLFQPILPRKFLKLNTVWQYEYVYTIIIQMSFSVSLLKTFPFY